MGDAGPLGPISVTIFEGESYPQDGGPQLPERIYRKDSIGFRGW